MTTVNALLQLAAPYEDGNACHFQILLTLFKQFTGDRLDCPRYGSHWEYIGFQVIIAIGNMNELCL